MGQVHLICEQAVGLYVHNQVCCAAKNIPALSDRRAAVAERRAGAHPDLGRRRVLAHGLAAQQAHGAFCGGHGAVVLQELDLVELRVAAGGLRRVRLVEFRDDAGVALEGVPEHVADADAAHADLPPEVAFEDPHDVVVGGMSQRSLGPRFVCHLPRTSLCVSQGPSGKPQQHFSSEPPQRAVCLWTPNSLMSAVMPGMAASSSAVGQRVCTSWSTCSAELNVKQVSECRRSGKQMQQRMLQVSGFQTRAGQTECELETESQ